MSANARGPRRRVGGVGEVFMRLWFIGQISIGMGWGEVKGESL